MTQPSTRPASQSWASTLAQRYATVRAQTLALAAPLTPEDCVVQSMPDASPVKWHLAHTTGFCETFVLAPISSIFFRAIRRSPLTCPRGH